MSEFKLVDSPLQMFAPQTNHRLITIPYRDENGRFVGLRIERHQDGKDKGESVILTQEEAVRLAKRLLCAVDGNGQGYSLFLEWDGDFSDRFFSSSSLSEG